MAKKKANAAQTMTVASPTGLNLRGDKSTDNAPLAVLPYGAPVEITGAADEMNGEHWLPVRASDGTEGFVMAEYLREG